MHLSGDYSAMSDKKTRESGLTFTPQFDESGLIPCITTSAKTGKVLMFAYMNAEALEKTIETGEAHYWSRSRQNLWHKGATSGLTQRVKELRTDCDQDCIWISVETGGLSEEASCHTGRETCFYRVIECKNGSKTGQMRFIDDALRFNPDEIYGNSSADS